MFHLQPWTYDGAKLLCICFCPTESSMLVPELVCACLQITLDLVALALYDIVLYCDDSGSMAFEEGVRPYSHHPHFKIHICSTHLNQHRRPLLINSPILVDQD